MYALCVLVSYVYLKLLTAVNFKNERKKKKKYALNIQGIVWSWKKKKLGVLKHDILREFEISKSTLYRFIVRGHVLLLKNLPKLKFLLIIFYFLTVFILFLSKRNYWILYWHTTLYTALFVNIWLLNYLVRFLGYFTKQSQQSALHCIFEIFWCWAKYKRYTSRYTLVWYIIRRNIDPFDGTDYIKWRIRIKNTK